MIEFIQHYCPGSAQVLNYNSPKVMGIINATPDSFYQKSRKRSSEEALNTAEAMLTEGVDLLDIGAMSSRPGADEISTEEEIDRLMPIIKSIRKEYPKAVISIDTYRSVVAQAAYDHGADIINDISAGTIDPKMLVTVGRCQMPYIMMHMQGVPATMQNSPTYTDLILDIMSFLSQRVVEAKKNGVNDLIIDPGIGFGKSIADNFKIIRHLRSFEIYDLPILVGLSRKSFLYKTLDISADEALNATTAMHMLSLYNGASILRVHDVKEAIECVKLYKNYQG